jgi:hypothetical protein
MKYDFFTLSLLATYEAYLPYMSEEDIADMLQWGAVPSPWKIRQWESQRASRKGAIDEALKTAILRQK